MDAACEFCVLTALVPLERYGLVSMMGRRMCLKEAAAGASLGISVDTDSLLA